jgi:predicted nucleic acid-binding protein
MARLVLADASPLIGLARVDGLRWLQPLFGTVWMPAQVQAEVLSGFASPDELAIGSALTSGWLRVCGPTPDAPALPELDEGETACIRLALAHPGASLLLMDERAGRAIAQENGLQVVGTAAIIGMAACAGFDTQCRTSLCPTSWVLFSNLFCSYSDYIGAGG